MRLFALMIAACTALLAAPLAADPNDIQAASRSVVRVVLVAEEGGETFYVGHGSGFAVAPDKIVTNAHLVAPMREDSTIRIGIIPSEGSTTYGGKIVALSVRNDLALIEVDKGRLPSLALIASPLEDGAQVMAIGYPAAVDRAQGLDARETVAPMAPVKTPGVISGGRTTRDFDTILHTAALAKGNSGGPLVDLCGRVAGVNSFGSLSDGNDAEYGFAVSNRELFGFLRSAKVDYRLADAPCRSVAELSAEERARSAEAAEAARARLLADRVERRDLEENALRDAEHAIIAARENHIAFVALMLVLAGIAGGATFVLHERGDLEKRRIAAGIGGALVLAAALGLAMRPGFNQAEDIAIAALKSTATKDETAQRSADGLYICNIVPDRSRIIGASPQPVELGWTSDGCVNDRTQYGRDADGWTRVFVPNEDQTVSINRFNPDTSEFRTENFQLGLAAMQSARKIRGRYSNNACTTDPDAMADLEDMQKALRQALPAQPNEVLVYSCNAKAPAAK
ncbi:S1C family serine protease [Blastomonas sp.]|uniref:S1C family serine protease n=1 Tax=Blastomonas sp. TaxID=1909299 RepID=UPI00391C55AE